MHSGREEIGYGDSCGVGLEERAQTQMFNIVPWKERLIVEVSINRLALVCLSRDLLRKIGTEG